MFQIEIEATALRVSGTMDEWGLVVRCEGEIDVSNLNPLETLFSVATILRKQVHLDLRQVSFFDATLIEFLLQALAEMIERREDTELTIEVRPDQLRPFRLAGADRVLRLISDERHDVLRPDDYPAAARLILKAYLADTLQQAERLRPRAMAAHEAATAAVKGSQNILLEARALLTSVQQTRERIAAAREDR